MKLELNKYYRRRDGKVVQIIRSFSTEIYIQPFKCSIGLYYWADGSHPTDTNRGSVYDLIEEVPAPATSCPLTEASDAKLQDIADKDARIAELEARNDELLFCEEKMYSLRKERDTLRTQLTEATSDNGLTNLQLNDECLRLRDYLVKQEQQLQAYEEQLTLQDEGPAQLLERCERQKRDLDYYAGQLAGLSEIYKAEVKRGYETRERLAEANEKLAKAENFIAEEKKWREHQTPSAPTIVKQTWQGINEDGTLGKLEHSNASEWFYQLLRRDYYSNGTVTAELEKVGG